MAEDIFMKAEKIPCGECQAGLLKRHYVTYFTWLGEELITVPDFPAWVCDQCGRREYDLDALNRLSMLLSPTVGKPHTRRRAAATPIQPVRRVRTAREKK